MKALTSNEHSLAAHIVTFFIGSGGEISVALLADLHGLPVDTIEKWALGKRFIDSCNDEISMEVLPSMWDDFKSDSHVCLAFHAILQEKLKGGDDRSMQWTNECVDHLSFLASRKHAKVRGTDRANRE